MKRRGLARLGISEVGGMSASGYSFTWNMGEWYRRS